MTVASILLRLSNVLFTWKNLFTACLVLCVQAALAQGSVLLAEDFRSASLHDPSSWFLSHRSGASAPCLTAADVDDPPQALEGGTSIGGCNAVGTNSVDANGSGALRLTNTSTYQAGSMLYDTPLPTAGGLDVTFSQSQWGGTHADGLSFFVKDGANTNNATGAPGGALGYASIPSANLTGVPGGLFGVGLDAYGGFSSGAVGYPTGCSLASPGQRGSSIAIRGPDTSSSRIGAAGYCFLGGTVSTPSFNLYGANRSAAARVVRVVVDPSTVSGTRHITVYLDGTLRLQVPVPQEFINASTFKFGFAGGSGDNTDNHEIWGVDVKSVNPLPVVTVTADRAASVVGSAPTAINYQFTGFNGTDAFSTPPTCRAYTDNTYLTLVSSATPSGNYVTHCSGGVAFGYVINYTDGIYSVNSNPNIPPVAGFGLSLRFDGVDDFVNVSPYNSPTGDFTIEFWVKPDNLTQTYKGFFGRQPGVATTRSPSMWQYGNNLHLDIYKKDGTRYDALIPNVFQAAGEWVHLAWVKSGGTQYYYRNGQQIHTRTAPPNGDYVVNNELIFGKIDNNYDAFFDEMRIWNVARSQVQINDYRYRYIANPNSESGLIHYWPLDEGTGTTATDLITGGNNGTLQNGPVWQDAATQPPITTPEDTPVSNYLKASDIDRDPLTFRFVTQPTKGVVTLNDPTTGRYTYTPNLNATGSDSFTYKVNDGQADSNTATITVTISPVNDVPIGTADHYTVGEDGVLSATTVLANDHDDDGDHLNAKLGTNPAHGTLNINADGTFTYRPVADYNGPDSFTYLPNDGHVDGAAVTVSITVTPANDLPLANGDTYSIAEDGVLTVSALGVLANDSDKESNPLTAMLKTNPAHGVLALHADGSFTYTPTANYNGPDSFTYAAHDGTGEGNIATVAITVNAQNDAPMGTPDSYTLMEDAVLQILVPGLLGNDSDPDGDALRVAQGPSILTTAPVHGVLKAMGTDGSFTYQPTANYNGPDSFTYVVSDGKAQSAPVTVTLTVRAQNDAPVAANDSYTVAHNTTLKVLAKKGVLKNDSDTDGDVLRPLVVSQPTRGLLHMHLNGSFTYAPPSGNCNADSTDAFTYRANDGAADSNVATVTITIHCVNRAPVANGDVYSVQQGVQLAIPVPGLMVNDSDPDGNQLTAVLVTQPTRGALGFNPNGGFFYIAPTAGADSFTYKVTDGALDSSVVTVSINVSATNHIPLAGNDSYRTSKNVALQVSAAGVLGNDIDADGNTLTPTVMAQPTHGSLHMNLDGSFTYTPDNNYVGLDSFVYVAHDGIAPSNAATVTIDVANANNAPVAANDSYSTAYNVTLTVPGPGLLANDSDPDGNQPLRVVVASQPTKGTLALGLGGGFTYTPTGGVCASDSADSFTYYANDSVVNSNLATASITIHCTNRAPVAVADSYTVVQGARLSIPAPGVLVNDTDPDGNAMTAVLVTPPTHGTFSFTGNGAFVYTASTAGTDSFTYKVTDGAQESTPVTVNINVTATPTYTIGGVISGLANPSALTLSNNNTDLLVSNNNGNFVFYGQLVSGTTYNVGVQSQPVGYTCSVTNGQGTVASANVTHIGVVCSVNSGPSTTAPLPAGGSASVSLTGGGGTCTLTRAVFVTAGSVGNTPSGWSFPQGVLDLATAGCSPSSVLTIRVTYPTGLPAGTALWKYGPTAANPAPHWYEYPAVISGNTLTYTITDGQLGDDDLTVNGAIVDPAGPGVPMTTTGTVASIPTLSEWAQLLLGALILLMGYAEFRRHGSRIRKR